MAHKKKKKVRLGKRRRWLPEPENDQAASLVAAQRFWLEEGGASGKPTFKPGITSLTLIKKSDGTFKHVGSLRGAKYAHVIYRMKDDSWQSALQSANSEGALHDAQKYLARPVRKIIEAIFRGPSAYDEYKLVAARPPLRGIMNPVVRERLRQAAAVRKAALGKEPLVPETPKAERTTVKTAKSGSPYRDGSATDIIFQALKPGDKVAKSDLARMIPGSPLANRLRCLEKDGPRKDPKRPWIVRQDSKHAWMVFQQEEKKSVRAKKGGKKHGKKARAGWRAEV